MKLTTTISLNRNEIKSLRSSLHDVAEILKKEVKGCENMYNDASGYFDKNARVEITESSLWAKAKFLLRFDDVLEYQVSIETDDVLVDELGGIAVDAVTMAAPIINAVAQFGSNKIASRRLTKRVAKVSKHLKQKERSVTMTTTSDSDDE